MKKKKRLVGTVARGIRLPIIREGDDIVRITVNSLLNASFHNDFISVTGT